jgi:hypothetical protein
MNFFGGMNFIPLGSTGGSLAGIPAVPEPAGYRGNKRSFISIWDMTGGD